MRDTRPPVASEAEAKATRMDVRVVRLHAQAPPKPAVGAPCNGCGVCCASEPCPVGVLVSRRRQGACRALQWDEARNLYRCGVVQAPQQFVPWLPELARALAARLARRWIAAGSGCDCEAAVQR